MEGTEGTEDLQATYLEKKRGPKQGLPKQTSPDVLVSLPGCFPRCRRPHPLAQFCPISADSDPVSLAQSHTMRRPQPINLSGEGTSECNELSSLRIRISQTPKQSGNRNTRVTEQERNAENRRNSKVRTAVPANRMQSTHQASAPTTFIRGFTGFYAKQHPINGFTGLDANKHPIDCFTGQDTE
ncbi:hypothetical protein NDU88_005639 [Pleurodeles waltl]|uniref:Uncharacterized protein n=1 Tax=Pleurodeles waltl TaxID=8319 RepID=A0AAV7QJM1_PLEWA|nr:hypothetical protein NDU88_005639 [Pleurodeles waltl]